MKEFIIFAFIIMQMEIIKKYKVLLVLALILLAGAFFFLYHFGHNDAQALSNFSASYENFDKAISDYSIGETDDSESKAGYALIELNTEASVFKLSSLTRNDAELMKRAREIAVLSGKELDNLRTYKRAAQSKNADLEGFVKEYGDLTHKRKTAYAHFRELAELKN